MAIRCEIKFDHNPYGIYFSGQTIAGRVELSLEKPKTVRAISVRIIGFAKCHWTETEHHGVGKNRRTVHIHYNGREDYLCSTTYLIGSPNGTTVEVLPGIHTYSFACTLPPQIPTSFEGKSGHIRYTIQVSLERPWKFDHNYRVAFTVLKPYDLNYDTPALRLPSQMELHPTFCCGPFRSRPLIITASIPQSGYAPGQAIVINAQINNTSRVSVDYVSFLLRKIITYYSQTPYIKAKREIVEILEKRGNGVLQSDKGQYCEQLDIPSIPPTTIAFCSVIHITYDVVIKVVTGGLHTNPTLTFPITIGSVPLYSIQNNTQNQHPYTIVGGQTEIGNTFGTTIANEIQPQIPIAAVINVDNNINAHHEIPPPSYEESVYGTTTIEENENDNGGQRLSFNPRYPVYHNMN